MNRKYSRENAMKLLFGLDFNSDDIENSVNNYVENNQIDTKQLDMNYFKDVVFGVTEKKEELDKKIEGSLDNWKLSRLSKVDLAIMRLCIYEILYMEDIPDKVSINEAINLSKKYSDSKSPAFINGVLSNFLKED